jgi:hypothetical protein
MSTSCSIRLVTVNDTVVVSSGSMYTLTKSSSRRWGSGACQSLGSDGTTATCMYSCVFEPVLDSCWRHCRANIQPTNHYMQPQPPRVNQPTLHPAYCDNHCKLSHLAKTSLRYIQPTATIVPIGAIGFHNVNQNSPKGAPPPPQTQPGASRGILTLLAAVDPLLQRRCHKEAPAERGTVVLAPPRRAARKRKCLRRGECRPSP